MHARNVELEKREIRKCCIQKIAEIGFTIILDFYWSFSAPSVPTT